MRRQITVTTQNGRLSIRWIGTETSQNEYDILDEQENYITTIDEETLRGIVSVIEEILQTKNKRDW